MPVSEDTINTWLREYLQSHGLNIETFVPARTSSGTTITPDFEIKNEGVFYGEAEWERTISKGWAQAHDYSTAIGSSGSFLILYPDGLRNTAAQIRITGGSEEILSQFRYQVAFLRRDHATDMATLSLREIPLWIEDNIHKRRAPSPDPEQVITTLRTAVRRLTDELDEPESLPPLFTNIIGTEPRDEEVKRAVRDAAGYILLNQIAFYRILAEQRRDLGLPRINPDSLHSPSELNEYFSMAHDIDYSPIFGFKLASEFSERTLEAIKDAIKIVNALAVEHIGHDILGKVFHSLIPFSVRKKVAAYYTKEEAADLLGKLAVDDPRAKIMDMACGSGTLLVGSYKRKRELLGEKFTEEEHKRFLEKDIFGIDIMPFAAHLSTIHLAIQAPLYKTDNVQIGIEDSTTLKPGMRISPLSRVIPLSMRQRTLIDFQLASEDAIEAGAVGIDAKSGKEINLEHVDTVIMNPPFTRHQSIAQFSPEYKNKLIRHFGEYEDVISREMSYCNYFLLLADKFLNSGGVIAAVLPTTILRGIKSKNLRKWLLENYNIRYIIVREDALNFSEDTAFREMLLIAKKGANTEKLTSIVFLKKLTSNIAPLINRARNTIRLGAHTDNGNFYLRNISQANLDYENLFKEIALRNYDYVKLWKMIRENDKLVRFKTLNVEIKHDNEPALGSGEFKYLCLNSSDSEALRSDKWLIERIKSKTIVARNIMTEDLVEIPKSSTVEGFRRAVYRSKVDVSGLEEYVVIKEFPNSPQFITLSGLTQIEWDKWKSWVIGRVSNLCVSTRLNISAPGTKVLSFFSERPRAWSRAGISGILNLNNEEAKIIALWMNSTINLLQLLVERRETGGAWIGLHKFILKNIKVPNASGLSAANKEKLLRVFDEVSNEEFPNIVAQLAMNSTREEFTQEELLKLSESFNGFEEWIGVGFTPRRKIDNAILEVLGVEQEGVLDGLYSGMLKEILILKTMLESR